MRCSSSLLAVVFTAASLLLSARNATAAYPGVLVADRHQISAEIMEGDTDSFAIVLVGGSQLSATVKAGKGKEKILPTIRLYDPTGTRQDIDDHLKHGGPKASLKKFGIGEGASGIWRIEIAGLYGSTGAYRLMLKVKTPRGLKRKGIDLAAGGTEVLLIPGDTGVSLKITLKERSGLMLADVRLVGPDGVEAAGLERFQRKGRALSLKDLALLGGPGMYRLTLSGDPDGPTVVDVSVSRKFPKGEKRKADLPPEASLEELALPEVVRQEDVGSTLEFTGANFLSGSTAEVSGEGVTVTGAAVIDETTFRATVDVLADALYGNRRLNLYPPPELGEPVSLADALTVRAPTPTVVSVAGGPFRQGDTGVLIEATGTGFRPGGRLSFSGSGLTFGSTTILSETRAQVTVSVSMTAPVGLRDVTYRHPPEGGDESATLGECIPVHYPDPVLLSLSRTLLPRGQDPVPVTLRGDRFHEGGTVHAGEGITVADPQWVSETEFQAVLSAAPDAEVGRRDLTYRHPAEGGGAAATLVGGLRVFGEIKTSETRLTASDAAHGDSFGTCVAIHGDTVAVGAPQDDDTRDDSGSVYLFTRDGSGWKETVKLHADTPGKSDWFGHSVAMDGDTIAVGAPYDDDRDPSAGSVFIFERDGTGWRQTARLDTGEFGRTGWRFGYRLALDGDTLAVTEPDHFENEQFVGAAYVFTRSDGKWSQQAQLLASDRRPDDKLGLSLALDGDTLVVGSNQIADGPTKSYVGAAYVFLRDGTTWKEDRKLTPDTTTQGEYFATCLALDGDTLATGSSSKELTYTGQGVGYVFERSGASWKQSPQLTTKNAAINDHLAREVGLRGELLLLSSNEPYEPGGSFRSIYFFLRDGSSWAESGKVKGGWGPGSVGEKDVVIGDPRDDHAGSMSGAAYVFGYEIR